MNELLPYIYRILPGIIFAVILLFLLKRKNPILHMMIFILIFIFSRDAMTPAELWHFGSEGFFWLRFSPNPAVMVFCSITSLIMVLVMRLLSPELNRVLVWKKDRLWIGLLAGLAGALIVTAPLLVFQISIPISMRGGIVPTPVLPFLFVFALLGNFYEEVLFRGFLQGWLEEKMAFTKLRAAVTSGIFFGFGHLFLAFTVTDIGWPLVVFATWEGCIAGIFRSRWGIIPATITHGLAIFILASGLI